MADLERKRQSRVLIYVTGDRPSFETQISRDVNELIIDHLDTIGVTQKISLVLYTQGGDGLAAWNLVNLLRQFCDELEIIVPSKAHSAGTLIALGAHKVVMTKQATLGPIDPSLNGPLNPQIPGAPGARAAVSVEAVTAYIELATAGLGIKEDASLANILNQLTQQVHPIVLGQLFRSHKKIQHLVRLLLTIHVK